ncbi:MAG: hypothetical protein K9N23_03035 [Akkermansiaceae bacterium]|nr:hypothetical protein [Akkermansiaceae bacterium]MCF7730629.1 hypothetical protein [Akkermansiaceae bacterium]
MKLRTQVIVSAAAALFTLGQAQAANVISIQFSGGSPAVTGTTGVVPAPNRNVYSGLNFSAGSLVDDTGSATTLSISTLGWNFTAGWGNPGTDFMNLYNNSLAKDNGGTGNPPPTATISLSSIPFANYDVYVYYNTYASGVVQEWSDGTTTLYGMTATVGGLGPNASGFTLSQEGSLASAQSGSGGNYLVFTGETASSLTLSSLGSAQVLGYQENAISGLQIVETIPEPSLLGLLALAPVLAMRRRRA